MTETPKDSPVFDHGNVGARQTAERHDEPGREDWHPPEEDEGKPFKLTPALFVEDSLFHPDRPFVPKTYRAPFIPRGV